MKAAVSHTDGRWALQESLRCKIDVLVSRGEWWGSRLDWIVGSATGSTKCNNKGTSDKTLTFKTPIHATLGVLCLNASKKCVSH